MEDRPVMREAINRMAQTDQIELTVRIAPRRAPVRTVYIRVAAARDEMSGPLRSIRWIIRDVTEARIAQEEVAASRERLRELTSELSLAEERVRREIAVGIHDRVSQPLALVKILLGKVKLSATSEQGREIGELSGLLQQAIDESRTLTFELSPPILYELGLPAAVEWLGEQMQRRHRVKIRTKSRPFDGQIPLELRVLLFQSIRELLTNVIKHARARAAGVSLRLENGEVQVVVSDDGVGFDSATSRAAPSQPGGFGLFSIRTRVERVGGQFLLESKPGHGTRVTLIVPILPEAIDEGPTDGGQPSESSRR
jgi:signal transduction histidine kinase